MKQWVNVFQTENKHYMVRNDRHHNLLPFLLIFLLMPFMVFAADSSQRLSSKTSTGSSLSISKQRQAELHNLLLQDCGSCHGMTMKGGLGPALTPEVLKTKSRQMIEVTILQGRPGTPMPPWNGILTKEEVRWLVDKLYAGVAL